MPSEAEIKKEKEKGPFAKRRVRRVRFSDLLFFYQNTALMLRSGIPIIEALSTFLAKGTSKALTTVVSALIVDIKQGKPLHEAMEKYPRVFTPIVTNMVKSGEMSGQLEDMLARIAEQMEKLHSIKSKTVNALLYPAFVLIATVVISLLMILFVLPKISDLFENLEVTPPLPTRIVIALAVMGEEWRFVILAAVGFSILAIFLFSRTRMSEYVFSWISLRFPIIKGFVKRKNIVSISFLLSSLLNTGIPLITALKLTSQVTHNVYYKKIILSSIETIQKGGTITQVWSTAPKLFPATIVQMLSTGEKSGATETILEEVSSFYEKELTERLEALPSLLEPLLILILGAVVGFLALAVIMPMYSISQAL